MDQMTMGEAFTRFLAACGALVIIGGAFKVIRGWLNPAFSVRKEVVELRQCNEDTAQLLKEIVDTNKLLCRGMMELLDYSINDGGGKEKLDKVRTDMMSYLTGK